MKESVSMGQIQAAGRHQEDKDGMKGTAKTAEFHSGSSKQLCLQL